MKNVFLPQTDFAIRAQLPQTEPAMLQRWQNLGLYDLRTKMGGEPFVLHDGPPYANGDIHIGHALNKVLKDFVVRTQFMLGRSVAFTPGWDCHGLPIEWKVEEQFRTTKMDRHENPEHFRQSCRSFAENWVDTQRAEFERLGVLADWQNPYRTSDFATEAKIVETFHRLVSSELVYTARKPVLWSSVEQTALASAEVEEQEHQVPTTWVLFPITPTREAARVFGGPAFALVWTTTPWSLPGNRALAINEQISYGLYDLDGTPVVMADFAAIEFPAAERRMAVSAETLLTMTAVNPLYRDADRVPFYAARYVTEGKGSGIVHVGPASSVEDWILWTTHNPPSTVPEFIGPDGRYVADLPKFGGMTVVKNKRFGEANDAVMAELGDYLVRTDVQTMTLKHSWRSRALLIENATPQWFIDVSSAVGDPTADLNLITFNPPQSRNRFESMLSGRADWLVSRQRMWGTPLAIYANAAGEVLDDPEINARIVAAIAEHGADAWLNDDFGAPEGFSKVTDVLDVWFDSGCVHTFSDHPLADLYLEGTDQHRGWFQSSFLVGSLTEGHPPYRELLTHGFVLDPSGKKQSKSDGNVTDPLKVIADHGADVLRLWVAQTDYTNDVKVGKDFKPVEEVYKKVRNTLRFLLGALNGYVSDDTHLEGGAAFEAYMLRKASLLLTECEEAAKAYDFTRYMTALHEFCVHDLSAFYFDVRKDRLYCDALDDPKRLATLYVLSRVFDILVPLLAPVLVFTAEEAWLTRYPNASSVHLERWPQRFSVDTAGSLVDGVRADAVEMRSLLETARKAGQIKGNEAAILRGKLPARYAVPALRVMLKEILLVSDIVEDDLPLRVENAGAAGYVKCDRCRLHYEKLEAEYCARCEIAKEDFA